MDIYGAESHMKKLIEYVEGLATNRPRMYASTKDRLKQLSASCHQMIESISTVLGEDSSHNTTNQVNLHNVGPLVEAISCIEDQLNQMKSFVNCDSPTTVENSVTSVDTVSKSKLSSKYRKRAMSTYGAVLHKLADTSTSFAVVDDCSKLLWSWFDARFFRCSTSDSPFRYNIRRVHKWISDIVITYGKHIESGTIEQFIEQFTDWCESLTCNSKFAVPYDVFQIDTSSSSCDMTLSAVVLWDVLLDHGLSKLCIEDGTDVYLAEDTIYKQCSEKCPELLDNYRNYKSDSSILVECKIIDNI